MSGDAELIGEGSPPPASLKDRAFRFLRPNEIRPVRKQTTHSYRPDVDGMRAIAVLPVMLFHSGLAGVPGGFVGVDIFFVISGFLIGRIILRNIEAGSFSLLDFYDRRVRRIIPPLLSVVAATLAAGYMLLPPRQYEELGFEALTTMAFSSNFWFWQQAGYFSPESATLPLLHTWSLANEEQFYLFFPLTILLLTAASRRLIVPAIVVVLGSSFALGAVSVTYYPSATYYLLPTRAWELMLGCLLASRAIAIPRKHDQANVAVLVGIALMLAPMFIYNEDTPFPGVYAAVPTLGAALAIWGGQRECRVSSALAARPLVFIGLLSYSLYLWHWPIFVMMRYSSASIELSTFQIFAGIALTFACAMGSVRFIEGPLRDRQLWPASRLYPLLGTVLVVLGIAAGLIARGEGIPGRVNELARRYAAASQDYTPRLRNCIYLPTEEIATSCGLGAPGRPTFVLWGDSHASAVASGINSLARKQGLAGLMVAAPGCFPTPGQGSADQTPIDASICAKRNEEAMRIILANPQAKTVILLSRWHRAAGLPSEIIASTIRTVSELRASGRTVVILGEVPIPESDVPTRLASMSMMNLPFRTIVRPAPDDRFYQVVRRLDRQGRLRYVSLAPALCGEHGCPAMIDSKPLYTDDNHMSDFAAIRLVAPYLERQGILSR